MAVILNAPAVFRFTAPADPKRHLHAAMLMGADTAKASDEDAGELVANSIINLIRQLGLPNGLAGVGYSRSDVEDLVSGTLPQHRVTKLAPRPAGPDDLHRLFLESLTLW